MIVRLRLFYLVLTVLLLLKKASISGWNNLKARLSITKLGCKWRAQKSSFAFWPFILLLKRGVEVFEKFGGNCQKKALKSPACYKIVTK